MVNGNFLSALQLVEMLSPAAQKAMRPFKEAVRGRMEIAMTVEALMAHADKI